tara:strand:+ start:3093 stop:4142 length:1050 start_codon:yes stop_codon:yes gene_type:complete
LRKTQRSEILNKFLNPKLKIYLSKFFDFSDTSNIVLDSSKLLSSITLGKNNISSVINFQIINDIRFINKYFEHVNRKLKVSGLFYGRLEVLSSRRKLIFRKYPRFISYVFYFFDFIIYRLIPKLPVLKKFYYFFSSGKGRVISKAEILGRLYSCGFEIVSTKFIDNKFNFVVRKYKEPIYDLDPSFGFLISLDRIGKGGKKIRVYKFRTMHPYAEYLQEYIYNRNKLQTGGKIRADFRISPEGRFLRKYWLDEIPMIWNIIKGDIKLVGGRPISNHYFSLYSEELKKKRILYKPGFIPPYYVDLPKSLDEIIESELKYLENYEKAPLKTDIKYLFMALKNVFIRGIRSK